MQDDHHHRESPHHGHGHNVSSRRPTQWQVPHRQEESHEPGSEQLEPDFDLVEAAFAEGFTTTSDPTSFLRLAGVPFAGRDATGKRLCLLRVEIDQVTDLGAITPHLGGGEFRYDPLPARLVSRRHRLRLVYHSAAGLQTLSLVQARLLGSLDR